MPRKTVFDKFFSECCTMKVGGRVKKIIYPETLNALIDAVRELYENDECFYVLGNASNVIIKDSGFDGTLIFTTLLKKCTYSDGTITAECGVPLSKLATTALENSLTGLEFAYGIPGTVGGGVYMNAGAYNGEISYVFSAGTFMTPDGNVFKLQAKDMDFSYRHSLLCDKPYILLSAEFSLSKGKSEEIKNKMDENTFSRRSKQPLDHPSCGSFFKRPKDSFAAALIDQCGLKGARVGGACVSKKHAGFIINDGNATADDIMKLSELVTDTVFKETGVLLEKEVCILSEEKCRFRKR